MMKNSIKIVFFLVIQKLSLVSCSIKCSTDDECVSLIRDGSKCIEGLCSNPFSQGCLRTVLGEDKFPKRRACNSDDPYDASEKGLCDALNVRLNYTEIRLVSGNWPSVLFTTWMMQVILSELLDVPATLDDGNMNNPVSFYDEKNSYGYGDLPAYNIDALVQANNVPGADCRFSDIPCGHVHPEVWDGQNAKLRETVEGGYTDPSEGTGYYGKITLYLPDYLARREPSLTHYYGLTGEENREKLARLLKRPTTWFDYCDVVEGSCVEGDPVASRRPTEDEYDRYFVEGEYTGYFRATEKNNCTLNPGTCTGHVVDFPCSWSTVLEPQLYWNDVALESEGTASDNGGYGGGAITEIIHAANATNSDFMTLWWFPDEVPLKYNLIPVRFPEPDLKCQESRVSSDDRCSEDASLRRGQKEGSCDTPIDILDKVFSVGLRKMNVGVPEALQSPAYDFLKGFKLENIDVDYFIANQGINPRATICQYIADNLEGKIKNFLPITYPRETVLVEFQTTPMIAATAFAAFVTLFILLVAGLVRKYRTTKPIRYAQEQFLNLVLLGLLILSAGAITRTMDPTKNLCVSTEWLVNVGYTLATIPLLIKVAAINTITKSSMKMKRVKIERKHLYGMVTLAISIIVVFMIVWTVIDPSDKVETLTLAENSNIVSVSMKCASNSYFWDHIANAWKIFIILFTGVIAFQNRTIKGELNESGVLGLMVYSRCFFIFLIVILHFLAMDTIAPSTSASAESFLYSFDIFISTVIYFLPKLKRAMSAKENANDKASSYYQPSSAAKPSSTSEYNTYEDEDDAVIEDKTTVVKFKNDAVDDEIGQEAAQDPAPVDPEAGTTPLSADIEPETKEAVIEEEEMNTMT